MRSTRCWARRTSPAPRRAFLRHAGSCIFLAPRSRSWNSPMTPNSPLVRGIAALAVALLPLVAGAQKKSASEYTVEEFFRRAEYQNMVLSPNGERLAATIPYKGRANLVI